VKTLKTTTTLKTQYQERTIITFDRLNSYTFNLQLELAKVEQFNIKLCDNIYNSVTTPEGFGFAGACKN